MGAAMQLEEKRTLLAAGIATRSQPSAVSPLLEVPQVRRAALSKLTSLSWQQLHSVTGQSEELAHLL